MRKHTFEEEAAPQPRDQSKQTPEDEMTARPETVEDGLKNGDKMKTFFYC